MVDLDQFNGRANLCLVLFLGPNIYIRWALVLWFSCGNFSQPSNHVTKVLCLDLTKSGNQSLYGPFYEKTCLEGFQTVTTQIALYRHRGWEEGWKLGFRYEEFHFLCSKKERQWSAARLQSSWCVPLFWYMQFSWCGPYSTYNWVT